MHTFTGGVVGRARCLVLFAGVLVISAGSVLAEASSTDGPLVSQAEAEKLPTAGDIAEGIEETEEVEAEEDALLQTPAAEREREESQLAYTDLSTEEAVALLRSEFAEQLALIDQDPARALTDVELERVLSPTAAQISVGEETLLMDGTIPVRATDEDGELSKVSLDLDSTGDGYVPVNPVTNVHLPEEASAPMTVGDSGLAITPLLSEEEGTARPFGEKDLLYPLPEEDLDLLAAPLASGLELFANLRSKESPEQLRFRLTLPAGAQLLPDGEGGAKIVRNEESVARIPAPTAVDAQGADVPVEMRLEGGDVVLEVAHRSMDLAYPALVDPAIVDEWYSYYGGTSWYAGGSLPALENGTWSYTSSDFGRFMWGTWPIYSTFGGSNRGLFISAKSISENQWAYRYGQWSYTAPGSTTYITAAGVYPFWRHDHNCPASQYSKPHDYDGLWSPAWSPQYGWIQFQTDAAIAHGMAFSEPPPDWRLRTAQIYVLGLGVGAYNTAAIPCWRDLYAGGAYVWLSDNEMPTFAKPSVSDVWTDTVPVPVSVSGSDPGLGVKTFSLFTTNSASEKQSLIGSVMHSCTGLRANPCPSSWNSQIQNYSTSALPTGINRLVAHAYDALGSEHYSQGQPVYIKVDHAAPVISYSGELLSTKPAKYHLDVTARDGNASSFATAQSGMKGLEFYLDGQLEGRWPSEMTNPPSCKYMHEGLNFGSCEFTGIDLDLERSLSGKHVLKIVAIDSMNRPESKTLELNLPRDETSPSLSLSGPLHAAANGWLPATSAGVTLDAQDAETGVTEEAVYLDGTLVSGPVGQECYYGGCGLGHAFTVSLAGLSDGMHTVKAMAKDGAGNKTERSWTIRTDSTPASLTSIGAPDLPNGWTPQVSSFTLNFSAADAGSGVKKVEVLRPSIFGGTITMTPYSNSCTASPTAPCSANVQGGTAVSTSVMPEGVSSVTVRAYDAFGQVSSSQSVPVFVDRSAPTVTASGPLVSSASSTLIGLSTELGVKVNDRGSGVASIEMRLDGQTMDVRSLEQIQEEEGVQTCENGICNLSLDTEAVVGDGAPAGLHTFQLVVYDWAGRSATLEREVTIDTVPPAISLSGELVSLVGRALEGQVGSLTAAVSEGTGQFESGVAEVEVTVDGAEVAQFQTCESSGCPAQAQKEFVYDEAAWGTNARTVVVMATDAAGNATAEQVRVNGPLSTISPACSTEDTEELTGGQTSSTSSVIAAIDDRLPSALEPSDSEGEHLTQAQIDPSVTRNVVGVSLNELGIDVAGSMMGGGIEDEVAGAFTVGQASCLQPLQEGSSAGPPVIVEGTAVVFPNAMPDTDTVIRPTAFGSQIIEYFRGAEAPTEFSWKVELEGDEELVELDNGDVAIVVPNGKDTPATEISGPPEAGLSDLNNTAVQIDQAEYDLAAADNAVEGEVTMVIAEPEIVTSAGELKRGRLRVSGGSIVTAEVPAGLVAESDAMIIRANPPAEPETLCAAVVARAPEYAAVVCEEEEVEDEGEDEGDGLTLHYLSETPNSAQNAWISSTIAHYENATSGAGASTSSTGVTDAQKRFCKPKERKTECTLFFINGVEAALAEDELFNVPEGSPGTRANAFRHTFWVALMKRTELEFNSGITWAIAHEENQFRSRHKRTRKESRMDMLNNFTGNKPAPFDTWKAACIAMFEKSRAGHFIGGRQDPWIWANQNSYEYNRPIYRHLRDLFREHASGLTVLSSGVKCGEL